jgi:hypothetical protein
MEQNQACTVRQNLQMMLMGWFCKFPKSKTVNYNLQGAVAQTGHVKISFIDG